MRGQRLGQRGSGGDLVDIAAEAYAEAAAGQEAALAAAND